MMPCFIWMTDTDPFEQSFNFAWSVLERTGELGEPNDASRFLFENIANMMNAANVAGCFFQIAQ